jgi:hypothetical protein
MNGHSAKDGRESQERRVVSVINHPYVTHGMGRLAGQKQFVVRVFINTPQTLPFIERSTKKGAAW